MGSYPAHTLSDGGLIQSRSSQALGRSIELCRLRCGGGSHIGEHVLSADLVHEGEREYRRTCEALYIGYEGLNGS
jgi:hypothetical protein